ncbi:MAG: hypothetical protein DI587_10870 [Variovorax paradoxus]|nr:MAG: hypothetical protein DI583_10870 [Variovorax paradoxus]PZQ10955.1 MAG: hypothetical protein DI587_10870 [Variovorax paradoxus]
MTTATRRDEVKRVCPPRRSVTQMRLDQEEALEECSARAWLFVAGLVVYALLIVSSLAAVNL